MKYFYPKVDMHNLGFGLQEVEFIKNQNEKYIYGKSFTIFEWGYSFLLNKKQYFKKEELYLDLDLAVEHLYSKLDCLLNILKERRKETIGNVKIAEEILKEEKLLAIKTSKDYRNLTNSLKNLDIQKILEGKGCYLQIEEIQEKEE